MKRNEINIGDEVTIPDEHVLTGHTLSTRKGVVIDMPVKYNEGLSTVYIVEVMLNNGKTVNVSISRLRKS